MEPLLTVQNVMVTFPLRREKRGVTVVDGVSFSVSPGEVLGIVGESGCGKTTLGRTILRLCEKMGGEVIFKGQTVFDLSKKKLRALRRDMQMIFQNPAAALNPNMPVWKIIEEALVAHHAQDYATKDARRQKIEELLKEVGLGSEDHQKENCQKVDYYHTYPFKLSGGQKRRVGLARMLAVRPKFVVADEPVSELDVSTQREMIDLLIEAKTKYDITYILISHDLQMIKKISDRIAVMYLGKIIEIGPTGQIVGNPLHPYTHALLHRTPLELDLRPEEEIPHGCRFHPRCPLYNSEVLSEDEKKQCKSKETWETIEITMERSLQHSAACHFPKRVIS